MANGTQNRCKECNVFCVSEYCRSCSQGRNPQTAYCIGWGDDNDGDYCGVRFQTGFSWSKRCDGCKGKHRMWQNRKGKQTLADSLSDPAPTTVEKRTLVTDRRGHAQDSQVWALRFMLNCDLSR